MRRGDKICPHCGQAMPIMRLGVRMTECKARLVDAVRRGADREVLARITAAYKSHIWQINEELEIAESPWRIVCGKGNRDYRLAAAPRSGPDW